MANKRLEKLKGMVKGKRVLILIHNNPDPDAIAAGWALSYLLKKKFAVNSRIVYGGRITRPENRTMIHRLGIGIRPLESVKAHRFSNTLIRRNRMPHFATISSIIPQFHVFSIFLAKPQLTKIEELFLFSLWHHFCVRHKGNLS